MKDLLIEMAKSLVDNPDQVPFMIEHGVSPPQSGTIHFQTRRN